MDESARSSQVADVDIHGFWLLEHDSLGLPEVHARALRLFQNSVVRPSLLAVEREIEDNAKSDEPGAVFFESDLADLHHDTVEGYLLTVQAMWERGLRALLVKRECALCGGERVELLRNARWSKAPSAKGLQGHFERLLGLPMSAFDSYPDLDLLQNLGNAIRHGDGQSAERVHQLAPSLWWNWLPPGESFPAGPFTITIPSNWPRHPSFDKITLGLDILEQMIQAVSGFWLDLELLRCNSFRRKHQTVEQRIAAWPSDRERRRASRVWTPA